MNALRSSLRALGARQFGALSKAAAPKAAALAPLAPVRSALARMCAGAAEIEEAYARPLRWMHWAYGAGFVTVMGTVLASQNTTGPTVLGTKMETKGTLMGIHKSTAVLLTGLVAPRILLRAFSVTPKMLPGSAVEHFAANLSHTAMHGFMLGMPATGLAMGWYGGKGVPFFGLHHFAGKTENRVPEDGKFAGKMFGWHKWAGGFLWYLLPLHVGAAGLHVVRGHKIFARINPFA